MACRAVARAARRNSVGKLCSRRSSSRCGSCCLWIPPRAHFLSGNLRRRRRLPPAPTSQWHIGDNGTNASAAEDIHHARSLERILSLPPCSHVEDDPCLRPAAGARLRTRARGPQAFWHAWLPRVRVWPRATEPCSSNPRRGEDREISSSSDTRWMFCAFK